MFVQDFAGFHGCQQLGSDLTGSENLRSASHSRQIVVESGALAPCRDFESVTSTNLPPQGLQGLAVGLPDTPNLM